MSKVVREIINILQHEYSLDWEIIEQNDDWTKYQYIEPLKPTLSDPFGHYKALVLYVYKDAHYKPYNIKEKTLELHQDLKIYDKIQVALSPEFIN